MIFLIILALKQSDTDKVIIMHNKHIEVEKIIDKFVKVEDLLNWK